MDRPAPAQAAPAAADELARGVSRALVDLGYETLREFRVGKGRRADVAGLGRDGRFVIVEIKSSEADFRADGKWREYLPFCDFYYFAVSETFPRHLLPAEHGLMIADAFAAAVVREAPEVAMNPTRRRVQILRFARAAGQRLRQATDPRL